MSQLQVRKESKNKSLGLMSWYKSQEERQVKDESWLGNVCKRNKSVKGKMWLKEVETSVRCDWS